MSISLRGVSKEFGHFRAVDNIDLEVPGGALLALLGPSGCGKTTLLRIIAGLETPDFGHVYLNGEDATLRPVRERKVGFVFQHYALFRHMTVEENVAFGLKVKRWRDRPRRDALRRKVRSLLELVQLDWAARRYPAQLSGGQRQRIALARALAVEPQVLLLDEPFGALDTQVRHDLRRWLRRLHDELHFTSLFVTHDQQEALDVADTIVVLNRGRIEQIGAPGEVFDTPASGFVHRFLGEVNELQVRLEGGRAWIGSLNLAADNGFSPGSVVMVRPHELEVLTEGPGWPATVSAVREIGAIVRLELMADGRAPEATPLEAEISRERLASDRFRVGQKVHLKLRRWRVYPA